MPFHIHEIDEYWNDVGSLDELRAGTFDALSGELRVELPRRGDRRGRARRRRHRAGRRDADRAAGVDRPRCPRSALACACRARSSIGDGAVIGAGAALKDSIVLPGTEVAAGTILIGAIAGRRGSSSGCGRGAAERAPLGRSPRAGRPPAERRSARACTGVARRPSSVPLVAGLALQACGRSRGEGRGCC